MAIEREAGFETKRVPCTEANGRRSPGHQLVPKDQAVFPVGKELETHGLARVAGAGHHDFGIGDRYNTYGISHGLWKRAGLDDPSQQIAGHRPLKRKHGDFFGAVDQLNVIEILEKRLEVLPVLLAVGGVHYQEIFILEELIEKGVINGPAGFVGDDRVLCSALPDVEGFSVIGQDMLKELHCPCPAHDESAHVGDIEEPCLLPGGQVLLHDAASVPQRHFPACEIHHLGAQGHVPVVENGSLEFTHGSSPFLLLTSGRPAALPGDGLTFNEGLQLIQAFLDLLRLDDQVGQADGEVLLSFHGPAKV